MTDARLPGHWLNELRFMDLDDKCWRIFTNALMWCAEQGTDGHVPAKYFRMLHADGVTEADIEALVKCGVFAAADDGVDMPGWADQNVLRQSLAADVDAYRQRKRGNQARYRERLKESSVTGHLPGHVGKGSSRRNTNAFAYVDGNKTGHVAGNAKPLTQINTVQPGDRCPDGMHKLVVDGTCANCDYRPGDAG